VGRTRRSGLSRPAWPAHHGGVILGCETCGTRREVARPDETATCACGGRLSLAAAGTQVVPDVPAQPAPEASAPVAARAAATEPSAPEGSRSAPTATSAGRAGAPRAAGPRSRERIGRYDVLGELGRGGMGVVYRARHPELEREVAVKVLLAGARASDAQRERFRLEAQAAARLRHPNLVAIHDVGEVDGCPFLVMDLIEGEPLSVRLLREARLAPREAARVCERVARALDYVHGRMLLHRDVKPANVVVTPSGEPLLTDFGLAKDLEDPRGGPTVSGQVVGTPQYMAPEQASRGLLDARTDVYGVGATLYELLTGAPPFEGESVIEVMTKVVEDEPPNPSGAVKAVPRDLATVCLTCLAKEPARRYPSAAALADDLARFLAGESIVARRPGVLWREWDALRRNQRTSPVTAAATVALALALGWTLYAGLTRLTYGYWVARFDSRSPSARSGAAKELADYPQACPLLADAVRRDASPGVRRAALKALEAHVAAHTDGEDPDVVVPLLMALQRDDLDPEERARVWAFLRKVLPADAGAPPEAEDAAAWLEWWRGAR